MADEIKVPEFIKNVIHPTKPNKDFEREYLKWLKSKAITHQRRDKKYYEKHIEKFGNKPFEHKPYDYRKAINDAVTKKNGCDFYTGEHLDWHLINEWDNEKAKKDHGYKRIFHNMPTLEHIDRDNLLNSLDFAICGWAVNDAKNDLSKEEFIKLCQKVVQYANKNS